MNRFFKYGKAKKYLIYASNKFWLIGIIILFVNFCTVGQIEDIEIFINPQNLGDQDGSTWETGWRDFTEFDINNYPEQAAITLLIGPSTYTSGYSNSGAILKINKFSRVSITKYDGNGTGEEVYFQPAGNIDAINIQRSQGEMSLISVNNIFFIIEPELNLTKVNRAIFISGSSHSSRVCTLNIKECNISMQAGQRAIFCQRADNITIENCTISTFQDSDIQNDGIYMQDVNNVNIRKNSIVVENTYNEPEPEPEHVDCIQIAPQGGVYGNSNVEISDNFCENKSSYYNNEDRQGIHITYTSGSIKIWNNIIKSEKGDGLINVFYTNETDVLLIYNNTIYAMDDQRSIVNVTHWPDLDVLPDKIQIYNNIFYLQNENPNLVLLKLSNLPEEGLNHYTFDHNLYYISSQPPGPNVTYKTELATYNGSAYTTTDYIDWDYASMEDHGRAADPLLSTELKPGYLSPAKNLGIALAELTTDIGGNNRPYWGYDYDAGAYEIEDTQLKFTSDIGLQTTHTLTYAGTYWERNSSGVNGVFNISTDLGLGSATCETPATAPNDDEIWKFPGVEYKWMDWSNNNSGKRIAAGLYKISNNRNNAYFYLDLRDAVESYNINVYLKLIGQSPKYQYRQNGTFDNHDIANGSVKRIWEINSGQPSTIGLSEYWANCLIPLSMNNHPFIVWGPYPSSDAMEPYYYEISRKLFTNNWGVFDSVNSSNYQYEDATYNLGTSFPAYYKVRKVEGEDPTRIYSAYTNAVTITVQGINPGKYNTGIEVFDFIFEQNYPNPFNPITTVSFSIPEEELVVMKLYDILGKEVKVLVNSRMNAGRYNVTVDLSSLSSGIYLYSINAGKYSSIKKMQLLK